MENNCTYHIIGAGVAGLYAAKLIKEKHPLSTIIIYEAAEKIGGRCGSYFDEQFNCSCDNATHVILNCNKSARSLIGKKAFRHPVRFWDFVQHKFIAPVFCLKEILLAIFNTPSPNWNSVLYVLRKLFPFIAPKAYFSQGNLVDILCSPLLSFANDIKFGYIWKGVEAKDNHVTKLIFNKTSVTIAPQDKIISAIDSLHYHQLFGNYDFEYSPITNIFFRTSMALTLPQNCKLLGIKKAQSQWLFCAPDYCSVTISCSASQPEARSIWEEICTIRDYNSAFLPEFKGRTFPYATIKQDKINNAKRPKSARTKYDNLFICGDWTMQNQPCCIETALLSAKRVVKELKH